MSEILLSVGLDVGTTSTQIVVSELTLENQASSFAVPEMKITRRKIRYESPVYLTPLLDADRIDGEKVRKILEKEYEKAGITREAVDTGAMIITGETSRKENAEAVLSAISEFAGDFVVATAGPDLESRLAAKGAGAVAYSEKTGQTVLHMDIGGGTSNLCLIREGEIVDTGCINVGGRLLHYDGDGKIQWISQALQGIFPGKTGEILTREQAILLAEQLTEVLEMAAGLRPSDERLFSLITKEGKLLNPELLQKRPVISFSGGVADCIEKDIPWDAFGDLGPLLGQAIRKSCLCQGKYRLGAETIRATVIGAGCHSAQLTGSTVFYQNIRFPLKNIPCRTGDNGNLQEKLKHFFGNTEEPQVLAFPGISAPGYGEVADLADAIVSGNPPRPLLICMQQDMALALGQALALRLDKDFPILCMDRVYLGEESYLDVGIPVGPAIPVVVKTLILEKG